MSALPIEEPVAVLVVDDESENVEFLKRLLRSRCRVLATTSGVRAIEIIKENPNLELVMADQRMPEISGTEVLQCALDHLPNAARIIATGYTEFEEILQAINQGRVNQVLVKPLAPQVVLKAVDDCLRASRLQRERDELLKRLQHQNLQLEERAKSAEKVEGLHDPLTGIFNQRYFDERLSSEIDRANTGKRSLSILLIELEGIKELVSQRGHATGDRVIKATAEVLKACSRGGDIMARRMPHKLAVILPDTAKEDAELIAKRLVYRTKAASTKALIDIPQLAAHVAIVIRTITWPDDVADPSEILARADATAPFVP